MEAIAFLIVTLLAVLVFVGLMAYETYKENKTDLETKLRQTDSKLQKYYTEMNTDRNDGWTKGHYKLLYEQRLKELKTKTK
jgi:Tfp pilus assembly protein PilE